MNVAVIRFPGSNCETESLDALRHQLIPFQLVDWNSTESLNDFTGFLLPGGFSYQDRIRAGVIAAKLPLIQALKHQSELNKPILGICNGAQILVESGILGSNESFDQILDYNYVDECRIGFMSDWGFLTPYNKSDNVFLTDFDDNDVLPIQICHGEGRFLFSTPPKCGLKYSTIDGNGSGNFPSTPNGSSHDFAAVSNHSGNILAIMPHPERSILPSRYPLSIQTYAKKNNLNLTDFSALFDAFKRTSQ